MSVGGLKFGMPLPSRESMYQDGANVSVLNHCARGVLTVAVHSFGAPGGACLSRRQKVSVKVGYRRRIPCFQRRRRPPASSLTRKFVSRWVQHRRLRTVCIKMGATQKTEHCASGWLLRNWGTRGYPRPVRHGYPWVSVGIRGYPRTVSCTGGGCFPWVLPGTRLAGRCPKICLSGSLYNSNRGDASLVL